MPIFWHRRDLRVDDNAGLAAAAESDDPVVPVFVFDDDVLAFGSDPRVRFMLDALADLRAAYRERGSDLVVARGDPREALPALADDHDADIVVWNEDYSGLARERDEAVREALAGAGVAHDSRHDAVLHEPGTILTNDGDPYQVFTYFGRKWTDREKADPYDAPDGDDLAAVDGDPLPSIDDLGFSEPAADVREAGTDAARERMESFLDGPVYSYDEDRDYPAKDATSKLSADTKWGTLGVRELYAATEDARRAADGDAAESAVETYQEQLAWREFYTQVLYFNPNVVTRNYKSYENEIDWRDDESEIRAWKRGETGYPIVDAAMRQLREEAWMHNRLRMVVASFLTKDLLVDWRVGYDHFRERLADHETGNDNGGWQWAASTGTDAQPYFRIFNPMSQGEQYDPDGTFVREYVPELRGLEAETIHGWHELDDDERESVAPDYPAPVVDHSERREEAIAMFERARGD